MILTSNKKENDMFYVALFLVSVFGVFIAGGNDNGGIAAILFCIVLLLIDIVATLKDKYTELDERN